MPSALLGLGECSSWPLYTSILPRWNFLSALHSGSIPRCTIQFVLLNKPKLASTPAKTDLFIFLHGSLQKRKEDALPPWVGTTSQFLTSSVPQFLSNRQIPSACESRRDDDGHDSRRLSSALPLCLSARRRRTPLFLSGLHSSPPIRPPRLSSSPASACARLFLSGLRESLPLRRPRVSRSPPQSPRLEVSLNLGETIWTTRVNQYRWESRATQPWETSSSSSGCSLLGCQISVVGLLLGLTLAWVPKSASFGLRFWAVYFGRLIIGLKPNLHPYMGPESSSILDLGSALAALIDMEFVLVLKSSFVNFRVIYTFGYFRTPADLTTSPRWPCSRIGGAEVLEVGLGGSIWVLGFVKAKPIRFLTESSYSNLIPTLGSGYSGGKKVRFDNREGGTTEAWKVWCRSRHTCLPLHSSIELIGPSWTLDYFQRPFLFGCHHKFFQPVLVRTYALGLKCGRPSVRHRTAPTTAHLHPSGLQQRPRPLSLPGESAEFQFSGEITQDFKQDRSRLKTGIRRTPWGGKVVGDAAGVCWGGEARRRRRRLVANGGTSTL
ncbi:hypothetical protein ACLB2K_072658 [Fragaria x ananassa]